MSTFLTSIVPVISLIVGTWLGVKFSLRNTLRALEIQSRQKEKERAEEARQNECQKYMKSLNLILIGLIRLRQYLVGATIMAKNDVHRLCVEPRIQALGEMFDKEISEMCGDTETSEISPLTARLRKMGISTTE